MPAGSPASAACGVAASKPPTPPTDAIACFFLLCYPVWGLPLPSRLCEEGRVAAHRRSEGVLPATKPPGQEEAVPARPLRRTRHVSMFRRAALEISANRQMLG